MINIVIHSKNTKATNKIEPLIVEWIVFILKQIVI